MGVDDSAVFQAHARAWARRPTVVRLFLGEGLGITSLKYKRIHFIKKTTVGKRNAGIGDGRAAATGLSRRSALWLLLIKTAGSGSDDRLSLNNEKVRRGGVM